MMEPVSDYKAPQNRIPVQIPKGFSYTPLKPNVILMERRISQRWHSNFS